MGSVVVTWQGTCGDRKVQEEIVDYIQAIANHSETRLLGEAPKRPAFLEMLNAQNPASAIRLPIIRRFDEELTGRILVDPRLAVNQDSLVEDYHRVRPELVAVQHGEGQKSNPTTLSLNPSEGGYMMVLDRMRVHGIDFQMFDPRNIYPEADRVSFLFLESTELPSLNGCMVQLDDGTQCQSYPSPVLREADWFLSGPSIHLRYYLEEWFDNFLAWTKYFLVPDLQYWRYDPLPHFEAFSKRADERCSESDREDAKLMMFQNVLYDFEDAADEWVQKMASWQ